MSCPCFSASVGDHPLRPPTRRRLGKPLPYQLADGPQVPPKAHCCFRSKILILTTLRGISSPFELLSPASGQVTNVLLTRSPLSAIANAPSDLHVLSTPPAFILSQDQTLRSFPYAFAFISPYFTLRSSLTLLPSTLQLLRCCGSPFCRNRRIQDYTVFIILVKCKTRFVLLIFDICPYR